MELGPEDVSLLERCPHFRGWYVQASMELGPEDVSLLERCPHFRGWYMYVQASMELRPEDVSLFISEGLPDNLSNNSLGSKFLCPTVHGLSQRRHKMFKMLQELRDLHAYSCEIWYSEKRRKGERGREGKVRSASEM